MQIKECTLYILSSTRRFHDSCKNVDILQAKIAEAELSTKHSEDDVTKLQVSL